MAFTEEELRDMEARAAWEATLPMVRARAGQTVTPDDLPDAPPEMPAGEPPPPAAPPQPSTFDRAVSGFAHGATHGLVGEAPRSPDDGPPPADAHPPTPSAPEAGRGKPPAPAAPAAAQEDEIMPSPGSPGVFIPGGMAPHSETRSSKYGKVVAPGVRAAMGEAGRLEMEGAGIERDANAELHAHEHDMAMAKVAANETAAAAQLRLGEDRDRMVQSRLAEIETLNKKAQGKPEDMWSAPHVFARLTGFLMLALGTYQVAKGGKGAAAGIPLAMGGKFIDGLINQDIESKLNERREASKASGRQVNLLHLHEERMNNKAKAIDATKLAYYDNVLQQMEAYKADHAGEINESKYLELQAQILKEQAETANRYGKQEQADVTDELVRKMEKPQILGATAGGNPAHKEPDFVVQTPGGVAYAMPNKEAQNLYNAQVEVKSALVRSYNKIQKLREEAAALPKVSLLPDETWDRRRQIVAEIQSLEEKGLKAQETAVKQGVLHEAEFERSKANSGALKGLGVIRGVPRYGASEFKTGDNLIAQEIATLTADMEEGPKAAAPPIVKRRVAVNPATGEKEPNTVLTGQLSKPAPGMAPEGSESRVPGRPARTMPKSAEETTPQAKRVPYPKDLPAPAGHHGPKKKRK